VSLTCPTCERTHKTQEAVDLCAARKVRRLERAKRQEDDAARRWKNASEMTCWDLVKNRRRTGSAWDRIVSELNKDWPPPAPGQKWDLEFVIRMDSWRLNWPMPLEDVVWLRIEKFYLGEYVSDNPLYHIQFPDGVLDPGTLKDMLKEEKWEEIKE
jgi:hypothetical protein